MKVNKLDQSNRTIKRVAKKKLDVANSMKITSFFKSTCPAKPSNISEITMMSDGV